MVSANPFKMVHYVVWRPYIFMNGDLRRHARLACFSMGSSNPNVSQKGPLGERVHQVINNE